MSARRRPVLLAVVCSSAVLGIGLFLPLWHRSKFTSRDAVARSTEPLWRGLIDRRQPTGVGSVDDSDRDDNLTNCLTLAAVAAGVGLAVFYVRRPRTRPVEAGDYSEGPGGAVRDGRA